MFYFKYKLIFEKKKKKPTQGLQAHTLFSYRITQDHYSKEF